MFCQVFLVLVMLIVSTNADYVIYTDCVMKNNIWELNFNISKVNAGKITVWIDHAGNKVPIDFDSLMITPNNAYTNIRYAVDLENLSSKEKTKEKWTAFNFRTTKRSWLLWKKHDTTTFVCVKSLE